VSLLNEARALARVRHPGVVAVHGIAENDGRMGMWMEYVHGATLAREIELRGALPPRDVARIGLELSRALESVHREGLVHADVKPANVVLEAGGRVVLVDFGLGKHFVLSDSETVRPSGTPLFMSPELLSGEPATPRSDLYALGVTLRWALTGQPPFRSSTLAELRAEAEAGPSRPLAEEQPAAPRRLVTTIERAMAPDPRTGFGGADRMVAALETALDEIDGGASPRRRSAAGPVIAGIAIAAILAAIALAPRFLRSSARTDRTNGAVPDAADRGIIGLVSQRAYQVDATFVRRSSGEFRHLSAGDRVSPGDQLSLEFCATSPLWVYVLNQDERGETYLLFPQPLFDVSNPIPADSTLVLPGLIGGVENSWTVTSRGGREHFLVVASRGPVADIERELGRLPAAKPGRPIQYAAVDTSTIGRLRAVGGVQPLPPGAAQHRSSAFDRFQALAGRETVTEDIWVRKITLENPLE
jgi:serine/threonine protein kinase